MNFKYLIEKFDNNLSIKNLRIRNIDIWPIVRNTIILKYKDYNSKNSLGNVDKQSLGSIVKLLVYGIIKFPFFTKNHKQIVFSSPFSTIKKNNLYINRVFDNILNQANDLDFVFVVKNLHIPVFDIKFYRKNNFSRDIFSFLIEIELIFHRFFKTKFFKQCEDSNSSLFENINESCHEIKNIKKNTKFENSCLKLIARSILSYKYYFFLFKKINPSTVFVEDGYYGGENAIINLICSNLKIKTIEPQHGFITNNHQAYNLGNVIPKYFPDILLTYGEYWETQIKIPNKSYAVGNFNLELNSINDSLIEKDSKRILIVSNGTNSTVLSRIINKLMAENESYKIYLRPHPMEKDLVSKLYKNEVNKGLLIDQLELFESLSKSQIVVSEISTVLFESILYCDNVFLLKTDYTKTMLSSELMYLNTVDESNISEIFHPHENLNRMKRINYYWQTPNSKILNEIIN